MTTVTATNGTTNGVHHETKFIETIDPEDPQYRRELQRPADVKEDMRQMESRQRVSSILNSQAFREELESIIADQLKHGPHPASLIALQHISELLLPNGVNSSRWHQVSSMSRADLGGAGSNTVIAINDIRGIDCLTYGKGERIVRCKLASLYRLIDLFGWSNGINNNVSVRLNQDLDHYLISPYGLLAHEITASSLSKVDVNGNLLENGSTTYNANKTLFQLHSAIYKARPDLKCIIHVQTHATNAISSLKCGLLQISQESILCGNTSYHEYKGAQNYSSDEEIKKLLADDFGPVNKIMFIRNYGVLICGETIEEAWFYLLNCVHACESQLRILGAGLDNIHLPNDELKRRIIDNYNQQLNDISSGENKKWKIGELEFEACMRCLDNAAYRTGYVYRQPVMRSIDRNAIKDVEIPPTCSSLNYDNEYIRKLKEDKARGPKGEWLNTPKAYVKHEETETGPFAKKITKWLESSPSKTSTPIRIDNKNQFAPLSEDPKELKNHQKQIKQDRYEDKKTPGHQSKLLENVEVPAENGDQHDGQQQKVSSSSTNAINTSSLSNGLNGHYSMVKKKYYNDNIDAGPQSKHLYYVEDASTSATVSQERHGGSGTIPSTNGVVHHETQSPSSSATYVYGAASKGIIKRDQQNNTIVYKSFQSSPNPFQQMDKQDIEKYKKEIEQNQLRDQVQRKEDMHKELLDQQQVNGDSTKKKSSTIPRSRSLLDKKRDDKEGATSSEASRDASPSGGKKNSSLNTGATTATTTTSPAVNKSATLSTSTATKEQQKKEEKPKKKSKLRSLSFLKSKKSSKNNNDQTQ